MSFRKYQTLFDLQCAALSLLDGVERDLAPLEDGICNTLRRSASARVPFWAVEVPLIDWAYLSSRSCAPEDGTDGFLFATIMLLMDRFQNPQRGGDFEWEWDAFSPHYRIAPDAIRSALMNGFREARNCALVSKTISPAPSDMITRRKEDILAPLLMLARGLTSAERAEIAKADYGCDRAKHLAALNALLDTSDCRFPGTWFPAEVVELVAHVPSQSGFVGCMALVLINAIDDEDYVDDALFRWQTNKLSFLDMSAEVRIPILNAFRHLYEAVPDWDPFWDTFSPNRLARTSFVPWRLDDG